MVNPLIVAISVLIVFLLIDSIPKVGSLLTNILLLLSFLWAAANKVIPQEQAIFYTILAFIPLLLPPLFLKLGVDLGFGQSSIKFFGREFKGFGYTLLTVGAGLFIYILMEFLQATKPSAAIIGVPALAVFSKVFTNNFAVVGSGLLGIIENRGFFTLIGAVILLINGLGLVFPVLNFLQVLLPIISTLIVAAMFSVFHVAAYNLVLSSILFAFFVFVTWIASYMLFRQDDTPANIAHFMWNVVRSAGRSIKVVT